MNRVNSRNDFGDDDSTINIVMAIIIIIIPSRTHLVTSPKSAWMCRLISAKTSWSRSVSMRFGSTTRRDGSYACPLQYTLPHTVHTVSNVCINIADRPLAATLFRICIDQQLTVMGFILRFEHIFRDSI